MDRMQRWGSKVEQRAERERYQKSPQHAHVPLRVLHCADCLRQLPATHPAKLGDVCSWCWEAAYVVAEEVDMYVGR